MHPNDPLPTHPHYRKAFSDCLRRGASVELALKAGHPTEFYIWRTRGDGKVRPSHAANEGRIFSWDKPPPTGHPGEAYGCRCWAEPYAPATAEYFDIVLHDVTDSKYPWDTHRFLDH